MARTEGQLLSREINTRCDRMEELAWWIEGHALS